MALIPSHLSVHLSRQFRKRQLHEAEPGAQYFICIQQIDPCILSWYADHFPGFQENSYCSATSAPAWLTSTFLHISSGALCICTAFSSPTSLRFSPEILNFVLPQEQQTSVFRSLDLTSNFTILAIFLRRKPPQFIYDNWRSIREPPHTGCT